MLTPLRPPVVQGPGDQLYADGGSLFGQLRAQFRGASAGRIFSSIVQALQPEILQPRKPGSHRSLSRTAWLDGLRGWAALTVCWVHLSVTSHHDLEHCYGYEVAPGVFRRSPAMWPYLRLLFSGGQFSVAIFFTISGFVLTRKLIALLHEGRRDDFVDVIHSAMFRRPIRLLLPVMWSTFAWCILWHVFNLSVPGHERRPTIWAELCSYILDMSTFAFIYGPELHFSKYNLHTWTIPIELRGSMLIFGWLFIVSRLEHRARIYATIGMMSYLTFFTAGAFYACFFGGMLIAEASLLSLETCPVHLRFVWDAPARWLANRGPLLQAVVLHVLLLTGLWLGSAPADQSLSPEHKKFDYCPVWNPLYSLLPPAYAFFSYRWFWFFWGAGMTVMAVQGISWLRGFFEWRFSQYLGHISFTLYLIHGHLIAIFSERLFWLAGVYSQQDPATIESAAKLGHLNNQWFDQPWWPFPGTGPYGLEPNFLVCGLVSLVLFLYLAEICTRVFDTPSVQVANWIYARSKVMS